MWNNQPQGNQPPYPSNQTFGYPPAPGSSPYPPVPGNCPYPSGGSGFPPYPPGGPSGVPYPTPGLQSGFSGSPYPTQPSGGPGYPYPTPQNQYGNNFPTSASPYPSQSACQFGASTGTTYSQQPAPITSSTVNQNYSSPSAQLTKMQQYEELPTIHDGPCDPTSDAQILRKAMKGFGTDETAIINVLARRTGAQRMQISQAYKTGFGRDLVADLKSELGGKLEDAVVALMTPKYEFTAQCLNEAMSGIGTKEHVLVDILCTATNQDMQWLNATYTRLFGTTIEDDVRGDTSGHFERLLVSMTAAGRNEDPVAQPHIASDDAQKLLEAGEKQWGTDEETFNLILATRSFPQLRLMFHEYERITGHSFEDAISNEFSGDAKIAMLGVVKSAKDRAGYFAERLHDSIAGFGTRDKDLTFILVTRAEIDLESIKQEYHRMYGKSLADDVSGDTSGDYRKLFLTLMGC